jgi:trehalose utilization protein
MDLNLPHIRILIWNEFHQEKTDKSMQKQHPKGLHETIANPLRNHPEFIISIATLDDPEHGLTTTKLRDTDVIIFWSHLKNDKFRDDVASRLVSWVKSGKGILFLHSAHMSKPFKLLLGTTGDHPWRNKKEPERIWNVQPSHPICRDIPTEFMLKHEEAYLEPFDVPPADDIFLISGFKDGAIFRTGMTWTLEKGKIVYLRPGHESYTSLSHVIIQKLILNAVCWLKSNQ